MAEFELHTEVHDGRGPHLLLVHGFLSSRAQWQSNLEALSTVCRPVVVELWGHGRSPTPEDPVAYSPEGYIDAFERIREGLGCEQWMLCGQSLGAGLTLSYALDLPERVGAHVMTNSTSAFATQEVRERMRTGAKRQAEAIAASTPAELERFPVHPARAKRLPEAIRATLVDDGRCSDPVGLSRAVEYTTHAVSSRERLGENRVPTLLVHGEREERFRRHREFAQAHFPRLTTVAVDAGHAVNLEAADAFNEAVLEFLRGQV